MKANLKKNLLLSVSALVITCLSVILLGCISDRGNGGDDQAKRPPTPQNVKMETVVSGLTMPWAMAFLPDGSLLVTERTGKLRLVKNGVLDPQEITGLPPILYRGQGGLLDVVLHPDYRNNGWIYISYSSPKAAGEEGDEGGANTALLRAKLKDHALTDVQVLFQAYPKVRGGVHFGGRIVFDGKGYLFLTLGERGQMQQSQNLGRHQGKVVRLHDDGKVPSDNPFVKTEGAKPEVWSYGHRNAQGMVMDPQTGVLWAHEHGPQGGDELNIVQPGHNYGWPLITYGIDYDNSIISKDTARAGLDQPATYWKPSIAPCGMAIVTSDQFAAWKGNLLVGSLKFNHVQRVVIRDNKVISREIVFDKIGRVRDIRQGPDGNIYVVVENSGSIIKVSPGS